MKITDASSPKVIERAKQPLPRFDEKGRLILYDAYGKPEKDPTQHVYCFDNKGMIVYVDSCGYPLDESPWPPYGYGQDDEF